MFSRSNLLRFVLSMWVIGLSACLTRAVPATPPTVVAPEANATWLVLSDIHFNPFDNPALVDSLAAASPDQWGAIFRADTGRVASPYGSDTNYPLFAASVAAMKKAIPAPKAILIAGDFLGHDFRKVFEEAAKEHSDTAYEAFVDKTLAFLAIELGAAFPEAQFVPALGNNDSYCGDYAPSPTGNFLTHMAKAWEPLVNRRQAAPDFVKQFSAGGYYTTRIADSAVRVVVTNSVLWSAKYSDRCAPPGRHPGADEMQWLTQLVGSSTTAPPTWILTHIPPGMDARNSAVKGKPMSFYDPAFLTPLMALMESPAANVKLLVAGHTHGDSFRVTSDGAVPMWLVSSISSIFKNNPAFFVATVAQDSGQLVDYTAFTMDHAAGGTDAWRSEYTFSAVSGGEPMTGATLTKLRQHLAEDPIARARFEAAYVGGSPVPAIDEKSWHAYWCGLGSVTPEQIKSCLATP